MTITELLAKLGGAFPAFNAKAMEAWASVYRARLGKHEGPALAQAYVDTLSAFSVAKAKSLFPVPADFEPHLPMQSLKFPKDGEKKVDFVGHRLKKEALIAKWWEMQGNRISEARGPRIAGACAWAITKMAQKHLPTTRELLLTVEQINICEEREVSSERMATFGPYALRRDNPAQWLEQMAAARETVRREVARPETQARSGA